MRTLALFLVLLSSTSAAAKVINVEFKFTPFTGDPAKSDTVTTVAGKARVFLNNIPIDEQDVSRQEVPVMFDEREVAEAVWVPVKSLGSVVRKGSNTIRIEFEPSDGKAPYRAELRWASVTDQTTNTGDAGHGTTTNQSDEGVDRKQAKGKVTFEREFVAEFVTDQPWHHYPAVGALTDDDKREIGELVNKRVDVFKPDFAGVYALLKDSPNINQAALRSSKCIDKAYAAGVRVAAASKDVVDFATTGGPAVVVQSKKGMLYAPSDPAAFAKIKGDEAQMCASMVLFTAYPPRLTFVRPPSGSWQVAP